MRNQKIEIQVFNKRLATRNDNQTKLVEDILSSFVTFATGKAGTGKTYLSVAVALHLLREKHIKKIILTRPAVDAGESLGFLPGTMHEKVLNYLMPLYDAVDDFIGPEKRKDMMEKGVIEIVPLAFMRGRTFNDACIIMDEAQNTTQTQMKMFLTRIGKRSKMVIAGDETQNDLPKHIESGLVDAIERFGDKEKEGISITRFTLEDIVRSKILKTVISSYEN